MAAEPDIFADGFWIVCNKYGCTIVLARDLPTGANEQASREVAARIRITPELAKELGESLSRMDWDALSKPNAVPQTGGERPN